MAKSIDDPESRDEIKSPSNQVSDEEFRSYVRQEVALRKVVADANQKRSTFRKTIKANGVMLGEFDEIIKMLDRPREEVKESFAIRERYARMMKLPVGTQTDMFEDDGTRKQAKPEMGHHIAFSKGYQAGVLGKEAKVPEESLDFNQDWMKGWKAGQDSISMDFVKSVEDAKS